MASLMLLQKELVGGLISMKSLLYFEEYISPLSKKLWKRKDINVIIIRTKKSMAHNNPSEEQLNECPIKNIYYFDDYNENFEDEISKFKKWLNESNLHIDSFLNDSEFYLEYANKIARALNLPALSEQQTNWVRDKVYMKDRFNEIGMKTVKYQSVESKRDILDFFIKNGSVPIIFKPRRGMNSKNVYRIDTFDDIENLDIKFTPNSFMVESFCDDREWSIESLVQNGKVLDSYVTYIPNRTLWAAMDNKLNCHMTVPKTPKYFKFVPRDFIQQIVDGMNLKNGVMTIEVFIDSDGNIMPSELGWRLPGCQATMNHSLSYGIDIYNLLIDIAVGNPIKLFYRNPIISVGDLYLPNSEGVVTKITTLDELMNMDGVIAGEMYATIGKYQKKRRVGNDASGWVQVMGKNEFDTLAKMQQVYDRFEIETFNSVGGKKYGKNI